jgi:hypothetical protein
MPADLQPCCLSWFYRHAVRLGLVAVIASAALLAVVWVFLVPIYQAPDEPMHLDYALALREHGGLFWKHHTSWKELPGSVHPYTVYLMEATQTNRLIFTPREKVVPEYGTHTYYTAVENAAPRRDAVAIDRPNKPFVVYPFGYYGLLALWISLWQQLHDGPVFTVFVARLFSVLLLVVSLICVHASARRLHFKPWHALLLTAAIGFFPLTTFVASAVQPDNLSFTLVSLAFYLGLRARDEPASYRRIASLGLALGALAVTKQHFFLCVSLTTGAMLVTRMNGVSGRRRLALALLFLLPPLLSGSVHLWTTWETTNYYGPPACDAKLSTPYLMHGFQRALLDYYSGKTHDSFWGVFGWMDTPLVIRGKFTTEVVRFVIQLFAWLILGLTVARLEQVASRLLRLGWQGRRALALRLACSDPLLNSYFLFTSFMFYIYIRIDNRFGAQGRNWWPLLLPIFLVGLSWAPRALALKWSRNALSTVVLSGLLLYSALGSYYGLRTIEKRYYGPDFSARGVTHRE